MSTPMTPEIIVATAAIQALSKSIVETFITPKLVKLEIFLNTKGKTHVHDYWKNQFSNYLTSYYEKYSIINTIAFNNQQRQIKDLYIPLTIYKDTPALPQSYKLKSYSDNLLPEIRKIMITDTAGMGKSTLSKNLFLSIIDQNKAIPILIELRRLNKGKKIIDEIVEQLGTLKGSVDKDFIFNIIDRGDFVFFFDGYDEIGPEDRPSVTTDMQSFISKANKNLFVITSRPDDSLTSFGDFMRFQIKPLHNDEAFELLRKYNNYGELSKILIDKVKEVITSVGEFLTNPLLVSLLYTAFEYKHTIPFKKHIFYRQVFDALFESHDLSKGDSFERSKIRKCVGLDIEDFHRILRSLGYECLKLSKTEFTRDEIIQLIKKSKHFCADIVFKENDFLRDITTSSPLFTVDGNYFKWSHKSLQEYFAAQFVHLDAKSIQSQILTRILSSKKIESYLNFLDLYYSIDPITFDNVVVKEILISYINFCDNNSKFSLIDEHDIAERYELTFLNDYVIVYTDSMPSVSYHLHKRLNNKSERDKFLRDSDIRERVTSKIFDTVTRKLGDGDDDSSEYRLYPSEESDEGTDKVYYAVLKIKPVTYILHMLDNKRGYSFLKSVSLGKKVTGLQLSGILENEAYVVDSNHDNILNSPVNFKNVTSLLKSYNTYHFVINLTKARQFLNKLEDKISISDESILNDL